MPSFSESIQVDGAEMELYISVPSGPGPFPAVVVSQHGGGVDTFIRGIADRLAADGYAGVAPDLYHFHNRKYAGRRLDEHEPSQRSRDNR